MPANSSETKGARFGCGFAFGVVFGAFSAIGVAYSNGFEFMAVVLSIALTLGFAAMRFGDAFWRWVGKWLP